MTLFSTVSKSKFLSDYWQQQPLVFRHNFKEFIGVIDGDELAGLACEEAVESRIVEGSGLNGHWTSKPGPFIDFNYDSLGPQNWSLLVQGVDQWHDALQTLLHQFDFLPRWRLEDIMASFAPIGGGVGPHFDYYDVFLIQASGRRRWDIGQQCDDDSQLQNNSQMKLLQHFEVSQGHELEPGDAIYIPAGCAHWGTSLSNDCVTLSVGFRAPSDQEILAEALELVGANLSESHRYKDTLASIDEDTYNINKAAQSYAEGVLSRIDQSVLKHALQEAFGRLVTDTRHCSFSEDTRPWSAQRISDFVGDADSVKIMHQPHCRMAYSSSQLFVNGVAYNVAPEFAKKLCHGSVDLPVSVDQLNVLSALLNDDMIVLLDS